MFLFFGGVFWTEPQKIMLKRSIYNEDFDLSKFVKCVP